jgi:WD40 repeat protein
LNSIVYSSDGRKILSGSRDVSVKIWKTADWSFIFELIFDKN